MANTPNLDLVKPAGTDQALISVINSNSDKIDAGFGSLSDQMAKETISTGITGLKAYKAAGIVNLVFEEVTASNSSAGWVTIGTLPDSLKPKGRNYFSCVSTDNSTFANNKVCNLYVDTNGEIKAYAFSDKLTMYLRGFVTYVCA